MKCKTCGTGFATAEEHAHHFDLHHRVSSLSLFTCGIGDCIVKVKNAEGYNLHLKVYHTTANVDDQSNDSHLTFKCPIPNCNYKAKSKATLRSHKFWHGNVPIESHKPEKPTEQSRVELDPIIDSDPLLPTAPDPEVAQLQSCSANFDSSALLEDSLAKKLAHLSISLTSKYHVPDSTLAYVLETYGTLLKESSSITSRKILNEINPEACDVDRILEVFSEDPLLKLHGPEGPLRSYYCRQKEYGKQFSFVKPRQKRLGLNEENIECKFHYVPIKESLQLMFEDDSVYEQYISNRNKRSVVVPSDLSDIHSGSVYFENKLFLQHPNSLEIILFQDDVELVKALGAAAGSYKVMHMGFTLGNLDPWNRSKVDPLQLLLLCKEKDVAYFGLPLVLEPIIKDLQDLETNGVEIRGEIVKASVLVLLGDNLGTHTIGGFLESFSSTHFFCRYCEESRAEWKARWRHFPQRDNEEPDESESDSDSESDTSSESEGDSDEDKSTASASDSDDDTPLSETIPLSQLRNLSRKPPMRTVESYNACVSELNASRENSVKGVVANCQLNKLQFFHVVGQSPPCVPHDIFEGFARYDMYLCLERLSEKCKFSLTDVNRKLSIFKFLDKDNLDKPPRKIKKQAKKGEKSRVKGNAVQIWTFIRFLPLIIHGLVTDKNDPAWVMILCLVEIVQLITSPVISRGSIPLIKEKL